MCPDRQMISLHVDGELPSPWKEKLEAHLSACPDCGAVASGYRDLSVRLAAAPEGGMEDARARVWASVSRFSVVERAPSPWKRRLSLPLPAAVAAVLAVAVLAAGGVGVAVGSGRRDAIAVVEPAPKASAVPVSDVGTVLRYLESQDSSGDILIIRLPDNSSFGYGGQPSFVKAADYNGRPLP